MGNQAEFKGRGSFCSLPFFSVIFLKKQGFLHFRLILLLCDKLNLLEKQTLF